MNEQQTTGTTETLPEVEKPEGGKGQNRRSIVEYVKWLRSEIEEAEGEVQRAIARLETLQDCLARAEDKPR